MNEKRAEEVRKILGNSISDELAEKLKSAKSDIQFCKTLADNGVDVEKIEKALPDEFLGAVSGGYQNYGQNVHCPRCSNDEEKQISFQAFSSLWHFRDIYRCRRCDTYFQIDSYGNPFIFED